MPKKPATELLASNEIRKHIAAVHMSGDLTFLERKLVNILLLNAFDGLAEGRILHQIPFAFLATMIGWEESHNTTKVREALTRLINTTIQFDLLYDPKRESDRKRTRWAATAWLAGAEIFEGVCEYQYSNVLQKALATKEIYAMFNVGYQADFKSMYALTLYENCVRFKDVGSTGWIAVELWRDLLGATKYEGEGESRARAPTIYDEFKHFKAQVLKPAMKEVNDISNIIIDFEMKREGRKVSHLRFSVIEKAQGDLLKSASEEAVRDSEAYKAMIAIGISKKAALFMATTNPERALLACELTKDAQAKNRITKTAAGYMATIFSSDNDLKPIAASQPVQVPVLPHHRPEEIEKDRKADESRKADADISEERRAELRAAYIAANPGARYSEETKKWNAATHYSAFRTFVKENA